MNKELKSYLAGIIDGEGYIGIKKMHKPEMRSPYYHERIMIGIESEKIIDMFHKYFGGSKSLWKGNKNSILKQNRENWRWEASDKKASDVISFFVDKLIVKKRQAELVLKLRKNKNVSKKYGTRNGIKKEDLEKREEYYQEILEIHGRRRKDYYKELSGKK